MLLNNTFAGLVSLTHLDLSNNKLVFRTNVEAALLPSPAPPRPAAHLGLPFAVTAWLQGRRGGRSVQDVDHTATTKSTLNMYLPFAGLAKLEDLNLANNGIRILTASQWLDLQRLVRLSLRNNNVQEWYPPVFSNLSLLTTLDLSYNSLSTVTEGMLQDFSLAGLEAVDLGHNAFQCDCSLPMLVEGINTSVFVEFSTYRCMQEGDDLSFEEYIATNSCAPQPPIFPEEEPRPSNRVEIIVFSVSLLLSAITTVTLYRKRW